MYGPPPPFVERWVVQILFTFFGKTKKHEFVLDTDNTVAGEVNLHFHLGKTQEPGEEDVAGNVHSVDYSADNKGANNVLCK